MLINLRRDLHNTYLTMLSFLTFYDKNELLQNDNYMCQTMSQPMNIINVLSLFLKPVNLMQLLFTIYF